MTKIKTKSWQKEFNKRFTNCYRGDSGLGGNYPQEPIYEWATDNPKDIVDFISRLLQSVVEDLVGEELRQIVCLIADINKSLPKCKGLKKVYKNEAIYYKKLSQEILERGKKWTKT